MGEAGGKAGGKGESMGKQMRVVFDDNSDVEELVLEIVRPVNYTGHLSDE